MHRHRQLVRDRLSGGLGSSWLWHVVERAGKFFAGLETLAAILRGRLPDDLHDG